MKPLFLLLTFAASVFAQDPAPKEEKPDANKKPDATLKPLKPGEVRILKAIVLEVKGIAQARRPVKATKEGEKAPRPKWEKLKINAVLEPGVVVRTGRKSQVTLRIGANATMLIDRQTRVRIPEIVQKGKVLRTRVSMAFGKADVKVDRIGLDNDFEVATPTATLAVRGTVFRIWWDVINGFRALGVPGNKIRAIEVRYVNAVTAYLSKADGTSEGFALPALDAFESTYLAPLHGALSSGEYGTLIQGTDQQLNPGGSTGLATSNKHRNATGRIAQPVPPGQPGQPGGPTTGTPQPQKQKDK